jgi:F0F1-type ATP synthase assembly protein I
MVKKTGIPTTKPYAGLISNRVFTVTAEVGCLTLLIVLAALAGGLWIDAQFNSKPLFTIILMVASVPVTMLLLFRIIRRSVSEPDQVSNDDQPLNEENESG